MDKERNKKLSQIFRLPTELVGLSELSQWVSYRLIWNESKHKNDKLPINPHDGSNAKANDANTWGTFTEALTAVERFELDGIGFEFANGYAGIDLDNVILDDGSLKPFAAEVVNLMDSYTEYSPSGRGLHVLFKLNVPLSDFGSRRRNDELGIEIYDSGRYFTVTGKIFGEARPVSERTEQARKVYDKYLIISERQNETKGLYRGFERVIYDKAVAITESELFEKMFKSRNGSEIRALFNGDISRYDDDDSRADLALASHLAFWTNNNLAQMDSLFRQSKLMRPKWDEKRGLQTYGEITLRKALGSEGYRPVKTQNVQVQQSASEILTSNLTVAGSSENNKILPLEMINIQSYIQDIKEISIDEDLGRFRYYKDRKTGYSNLDAKMSLYPGLYVLGAISSLGKTTFCGQMADQLASAGEHILYFSLEQTRLELVCKGLSRLMARTEMMTALTSMEIRQGSTSEALRIARENYATQSEHEYIIECGFETNVEAIVATVKDYISRTGSQPIVIVDYLQILPPVNNYQTTKDVVDYNVRALKKLQTENDLVVIVISSLNRANYLTPIDFSSFKESGGIEYTADVIWGLQLSVMNEELFDKDAKLKAKREMVKEAKVANPREIELVCLKNRYGISSYSCNFKYYARYDLFIPEKNDGELLFNFKN